ncbi:MAG: hypothetical protein JWR09_1002 [Mucilaginibacter sp.]|nr:hypothetical protein [Mucilaginibacter sp.]
MKRALPQAELFKFSVFSIKNNTSLHPALASAILKDPFSFK